MYNEAETNTSEFSKFDQLIYIVTESDLDDETINSKVVELFPAFDPSDTFNDKYLTPYTIEMIAYRLSLGLPLIEVAYSLDLSATLIKQIYVGERVSLKALVNFAKAITFARSKLKAEHLSNIEKTDGINASVTFLEKAFSNKYGDRKIIDIQTGFDTEDAAQGWHIEVHKVDNKIAEAYDAEQAARSVKIKDMEGNDE